MKGYKVFNSDWQCENVQFEVGRTYEMTVMPKVNVRGFHFCENAADCFNYCDFVPSNKVAVIDAEGDIDAGRTVSCTNRIRIIEKISWNDVLELVSADKECEAVDDARNMKPRKWNIGNLNIGAGNTGSGNSGGWNSGNWNIGNQNTGDRNPGDRNTGDQNPGNKNTGDRNPGDRNTGDRNPGDGNTGSCNNGKWNSGDGNTGTGNTGDWNSGDWNTGSGNCGRRNTGNRNYGNGNTGDWNLTNYSSGCFNRKEPTILMFDSPTDWTYADWRRSDACRIMSFMPTQNRWIPADKMTDEEKAANPCWETTNGYLKKLDTHEYKAAVQTWWDNLPECNKESIIALPNFNADAFMACTGINV